MEEYTESRHLAQVPFKVPATDLSDILFGEINPHASQCVPLDKLNCDLIGAGASLHWLHAKAKNPVDARWSELPNRSESDLRLSYRPGLNIGIRLGQPSQIGGDFLHLVDLDIRDASKAVEAWTALLALWPAAKGFPSVVSGSGGESRHLYFLSPEAMRKRKLARSDGFTMVFDPAKGRDVKKFDWEIDLLGTGAQAVLPPSLHPVTGQPYRWERPLELGFPLAMQIDPKSLAQFGARQQQDGSGEPVAPLDVVNQEHLARALEAFNVDDRDDWLKVGMALHHQYAGLAEGYSIWSNWGKASAKYQEKDSRRVWKSFKARKRNAKGLRQLFREIGIEGYERQYQVYVSDDDFDDMPALPAEAKKTKIGIIIAKNGEMKPTLHNAILVLSKVNRDESYSIRKNDMTGQDEWRAGPINDADLGLIRVAIEQAGMHNVGADLTAGAVRAVAELNSYHPVKDWLESLHHDGNPRLDTWLTRYLGVDASLYSRAVGRAFLVAMVARVMQPGCKHDHVLILRGEQGIRKSTACRILSGDDYFSDTLPAIKNDKIEAYRHLRGKWLIEMGELASATKSLSEDLKSFLSGQVDAYRAPYARKDEIVKRQCVFVGTTNEDTFLRDASGGRRFWPVTCGAKIDTEGLAADREQLFAEAVAAFRAGEAWHLSPDMEQLAKIEQEAAREEHPWEQRIREILNGLNEGDGFDRQPKDSVTTAELLGLLGIPTERQHSGNSKQVAGTLKRFGWKNKHTDKANRWVRA